MLFQSPLSAVLCVLDQDAESLEVIADTVACCPVLCCLSCLSLFKNHVHEAIYGLYGLSVFAFFIAQTEDSEHDVVEKVDKSLPVSSVKSQLFVFCCVDDSYCIKYMRECDRGVEVVAESFINTFDKCLDLVV